jgi:F-type H+-transporting ATPase subunit b
MVLAESTIQLVPDGTLLLHLLMIVVMVILLNRTLLKPINKILADRDEQVSGRINEARKIRQEAESKVHEYELALRSARAEAYGLLEKERAVAVQEKDAKVRTAREEINRTTADAMSELQRQQERVKHELEVQASSIGELISIQILERRS